MATWTPRQQKYMLWLAAPKNVRPRTLRTKTAIATKLVVSPMTLRQWEQLPGWWDAVFAQARSILGHEMSSILTAMVREAKAGSVQAAKLCLQVLGVHADKVKHEIDIHQDQLILIMHPEALPPRDNALQLPQSDAANVIDVQPVLVEGARDN